MGQALDKDGRVLGEAEGDSAREVLEKLQLKHRDAAEFRIQQMREKVAAAEAAQDLTVRLPAQAQREMPRYQCHKIVHALKIKEVIKHAHPDPNADDAAFEASSAFQGAHLFPEERGYAPIAVDAAWYRKHDPTAGGYYVVYEDGYTSFSPAAAFESGYTRLGDVARAVAPGVAGPKISVGRIVQYALSQRDVDAITRRRTNGYSIAERMKADPPTWPAGAQAHIGSPHYTGQLVPLIVVVAWEPNGGGINGQAILDGNDVLWVTGVTQGTAPGTWRWPERV